MKFGISKKEFVEKSVERYNNNVSPDLYIMAYKIL
jgi:hypothetical protein